MTVVIHDLSDENFSSLFPNMKDNVLVIADHHDIKKCSECFYCWTKTPGKCRLDDHFSVFGDKLAECSRIIIISKCKTGDFSPSIKNILKRSTCFIHNKIETDNGSSEIDPIGKNLVLSAYFYGKIPDKSKDLLHYNTRAQALTLNAIDTSVHFVRKSGDIQLEI